MTDNDFITLDDLALSLAVGGQQANLSAQAAELLARPSGEKDPKTGKMLTCEQALDAHCSGLCTAKGTDKEPGALSILQQLRAQDRHFDAVIARALQVLQDRQMPVLDMGRPK